MSARRVVILLVLGVVVIGGALWLSSQRHLERATLTGDTVLPGLKDVVNNVTEIRISKGDGTRTTLRKRPADWVVAERDYPADSGRVRKLLLDLGELAVVEEKTRQPANYPLLGVEDVTSPKATGTKLEAVTPAKTFALIVGKPSGAKGVFVRSPGSPQSLQATPQITADSDPKRWLDHTLLDITQDHIKQVAVKPATGPAYTVSRENADQNDFTLTAIPKGRELSSPSAPNPVAAALASVSLDDVRRAGDASATPPASAPPPPTPPATPSSPKTSAPALGPEQAVFHTFTGLELTIDGRRDGERRYISVAASSSAKESAGEAQTLNARLKGWEFEIPTYKYEALFRPLEELLKPKPEKASKPSKPESKS